MKLSNISVIFIIIVIPIILLLSYYISSQIDTINMQTSYTSKQLRATKEAIEAFEINTVEWNESYSENADSKRRDVMASINTFTTGFANSIGVGGTNKEIILTYIPAIVCTLYDGYYIYTPSEVKEVIKDENGVAVFWTETLWNSGKITANFSSDKYDEYKGRLLYKCKDGQEPDGTYSGTKFTFDGSKAVSKYEHILKPFSTYSARYKKGNIDITVNYTLDNYITIYGMVNDEYVVKYGYLIDTNTMPENIQPEELSEKIAWRWNEDEAYTCKTYPYVYAEDNTKVYFEEDNTTPTQDDYITFQVSSIGVRTNLNDTTSVKYKKIRKSSKEAIYQALNNGVLNTKNEQGEIETIEIKQGTFYINKKGKEYSDTNEYNNLKNDYSAWNYYIESIDFTEWVQKYLSEIQVKDIELVFNENISDEEKQRITNQYNRNDEIFKISEINNPEEQDSIFVNHKREIIKQTLISNLNQSITSYSRSYSNGEFYLPVLSDTDWDQILRNVSIITFLQNIPIGMKYYNNYAVATSTSNKEYVNPNEIYLSTNFYSDGYYHLPYCEKLKSNEEIIGYRNIDFVVKSYSAVDEQTKEDITKYYYKHQEMSNQSCYYCLVQRDLYSSEKLSNSEEKAHDKAYKIALARERYRSISKINVNDVLDLDVVVTFNENYEGGDTYSKLVGFGGDYGERRSTRITTTNKRWI